MDRGNAEPPLAIMASNAPPWVRPSNYPEPFRSRMAGRTKRPLADLFGIANFGVNLTTLEPGSVSALLHRHSKQDEFVYMVDGSATLMTDDGEIELRSGMCAGFPAGCRAHHLVNRSDSPAVYLEVGDRSAGDVVDYPEDDLAAVSKGGVWAFARKDGTPY
ncbi:hypothetical protein FP2506_12814 [Fulvimarina pelagi HTCC2506]|uniref:Cupin type-2 domain-containing protein n=2 Tax=Fulvimarina pelagi TaxID=217511 RepID=Q0G1D3_9HYPH|nr:cupin domain-containing protein [Fulvimarina pelagi]EAU41148.1 hypothetical protein FP2506_12814 [Fulvimarina pelagi HTCC2506]BAT30838.1 cupin 2 protein [Fulvimarina pelagi]